jgi:hypothetical protein
VSGVNSTSTLFVAAGLFLGLELFALLLYQWRNRRGIAPLPLLANAGAGGCLLLAAWLSSIQGSMLLLSASLGAAFLFHVLDHASRWRS